MSMLPPLSWSQLTHWRAECYQRFGNIHQVPIRNVSSVPQEFLKPGSRVLDVGAGVDKPFKQFLTQPGQEYYSLDSDPEGDFDYHSFSEIGDEVEFDLVVANQVLEHLTIAETYDLLCSAQRHLVLGGILFATVPNTAHPVRQWDPTHITPWPMNDLYSIFKNAGFEVLRIARYNKYPLTSNPVKRFIIDIVCNAFRVDWCDSLMIVGQKQVENDSRKKETRRAREIPLGHAGNHGTVFAGRWSDSGNSTFLEGQENDVLSIGAFCSIAPDVTFILSNRGDFSKRITNFPIGQFFRQSKARDKKNYTRVGNDVNIGSGVIILPGIKIGNGVVVTAGSVVTEDVMDYSIIGGNPAKQIATRFESENLQQKYDAICWWEWDDETIKSREEFFRLPYSEAIHLAYESGWVRADGVPKSYLHEVSPFFALDVTASSWEEKVREFLNKDDTALLLHRTKSLSFENLAVWMAALQAIRPNCIVEFGTQSGCSSTVIARLCRYLGIKTRIITINIQNELQYPDPDVEYVIEDFTRKMDAVWDRWNPDIIFQDAHMYKLIQEQLVVSQKHRHTIHVFHDVGFRLFRNPMTVSLDAVPTGASGTWERHVLGTYAPALLDIKTREFENESMKIHIFDATANPREFGIGVLKFK